jgi:hypothetical protein
MSILANTITADMGMISGLAFVGPAMGLPLSVLASFVERPFYALAGVKHHTIWYSLRSSAAPRCSSSRSFVPARKRGKIVRRQSQLPLHNRPIRLT